MSLATEVLAQRSSEPRLQEPRAPKRAGAVPSLQTERLVLRAPRRGDAKAMARLANDRRIAANTLRLPHPFHLADAEGFIAAANRQDGEAAFAVTLADELIGICAAEPRDGAVHLGYWIGVPFWGCGYATEAVRAVIDHAFGALGHAMLAAGARVNNPASRRVLEKCGFQWTDVGLYRIRAINSSAPFDRFRLDRGLWASLKAWGPARELA